MTDQQAPRTERIVLRADKPFLDRLDAVARDRFEGNRSVAVRQAVRELIERYERMSAHTDRERVA